MQFKLGNAVYFFPRYVIVGCIGGIGVFVTQTGMEVSTDIPWKWTAKVAHQYIGNDGR